MKNRFWITVAVVVLLVTVFIVPSRSIAIEPESSLGVVYADGRATEDIPLYRVDESTREYYISAYDLARIFRATKFWRPGARKLALRIGQRRYLFTIDTRVVMVDEETCLLHVPVRYVDGDVMIPLEFIPLILAERVEGGLEYDSSRLLLVVGSPRYNIESISFVSDEKGSRAVISLTEELLYHVDSETPGLLRIKIYGGKLNPRKFTISEPRGLFNRVRAEQTSHDSYLFFDVSGSARRFRVNVEPDQERNRYNLVIYLEKGKLPEIPDAEFSPRRMVEIFEETERKLGPLKLVAIDPGHGGIDRGKIGPSGVMEKEVNLQVALLLADALRERLGVDVVLTRTEDVLIPLDKRAEIANSAGADIFISLHCNGWFHPEANGVETFFLAPARTEDEVRLANEENLSLKYENPSMSSREVSEIQFILWDMVQNEYISESSELAEIVQQELGSRLGIRNRGVKQAGLKVLKGLKMPAVLVEMGFLSNPEEEHLLTTYEFRMKVVNAIVDAIIKFQERYATAGG